MLQWFSNLTSRLWNKLENWIESFGQAEWILAFLLICAIGCICMRGDGSRAKH